MDALILAALREDGARRDLTTLALVPPSARAQAVLRARQAGVAAGLFVFARVFRLLDRRVRVRTLVGEGQPFRRGAVLARVEGPARALLSGERVALNFTQRLCGIATLTQAFTRRSGRMRVMDTRKTTPLLRRLERHAVACGGGRNHRFNLSDAVLIKDNHLRFCASPSEAVARARRRWKGRELGVEVESLVQLRSALEAKPDYVLLDNMLLGPPQRLRRAFQMARGCKLEVEVSGGVGLSDLRRLASLGIDRVSVGALTHAAKALDLALEFL